MTFTQIIYKNKFLCYLYCFVSRIKYHSFFREVGFRSKLDIFDYKNIAKPLPKCYREICTDNNCFGIGYSLRKYAGYQKSYVNGWIEHGYFFADVISSLAAISFTNNVITFGNHREEVNKMLLPQKKCYKIGPYVHYAEDYITEDKFIELKKELGRVLLVFPVHAGTGNSVQYEKAEFFKLVESVASGFDTVLFSLFWTDIKDDYVTEIEKRGYRIVCSGHRYDPFFLSRQKTIIKLADVTMSNGLGTNLVYCTYYKKPHWLIRQQKDFTSNSKKGDKNTAYINKIKNNSSVAPLIYESFKEYCDVITDEQYELCSEIFGFNDIKSREEMLNLLNNLK